MSEQNHPRVFAFRVLDRLNGLWNRVQVESGSHSEKFPIGLVESPFPINFYGDLIANVPVAAWKNEIMDSRQPKT